MKLLVLSNVNVAPIAGRVPGHDVEVGDYGDVVRALVDPTSRAHAPEIEAIVLLLDGDVLVGSGELGDEVVAALETFARTRPDTLVVASTVRCDAASPLTYGAALTPEGPLARELEYNSTLRRLCDDHRNLAVLDVGLVFDRHSRDRLVSPTFWYAGRIRYTSLWFEECGRQLAGLLGAYRNQARKVLVCDLDGTLWGGVLGEDGPAGIALGEDGVGRCFRDVQRRIKTLQENGVVLAIASKNEPSDVEQVFADHPMMVIRADDVAAWRVNWEDKALNLVSMAAELSLGLDAFVFLDDNPVERALVAEALPEVAVPDVPVRPELRPDWFVREVAFPFFSKLRVLDEDRHKTDQYRARGERTRALEAPFDLASFLDRLEIHLDIRVDDPLLVERAAQMTAKTNQFNLTMRRCTSGEILAMMEGDRYEVLTAAYADRFGDEGVIGLAILDADAGEVVVFLLSCRVIGRRVEDQLLDRVEEIAAARNIAAVECQFVPTARNGVAAAFLPARGWQAGEPDSEGVVRFRRELA